jgi:hypothetical protein
MPVRTSQSTETRQKFTRMQNAKLCGIKAEEELTLVQKVAMQTLTLKEGR